MDVTLTFLNTTIFRYFEGPVNIFIAKLKVHDFPLSLLLRGGSIHVGLGPEGVKLEAASGRGSTKPEDYVHLRQHGGLVAKVNTQASHKQSVFSLSRGV